ncbi:FMRFamide receptor-like [Dreissena polymorpha]|uniref:FMRFamide receptor-like n=1 Tax=Dreissena polymorpha TaxID=45954 RepID=UPI002264DB74|nr:FMRFamide receptor-like [Dreissena polymorpha]XP_052231903.1 FMRFamide receptor-like [Dreissena polymorpha]
MDDHNYKDVYIDYEASFNTTAYYDYEYIFNLTNLCQNDMQKLIESIPGYSLCMITLLPILCVFGIIGIIVTIIVLSHKSMSTSTNNYLISIAVTDLLFLIVLGVRVFDTRLERVTHHYYLVVMTYGSIVIKVFLLASIWLTVMLTVERYIAICHPLRAMTLCTVVRARIIIISIVVIAILYHTVDIFRYEVQFHWDPCVEQDVPAIHYTQLGLNQEFRKVYSWVDCFLLAGAPIILVFILNILLILEIHRSTKYLRYHLANDSNVRTIISKEEKRLTWMLIMVVIVSVVCQGPYIILSMLKRLFPPDILFAHFTTITYVTILWLLMRSSFNFIIYCWFSEKFWNTFKRTLCAANWNRSLYTKFCNNSEHGLSNNNRKISVIHSKETTC